MGGKQTKRARKFSSKGGVKARLEKGTVTNKGKLKRKRKGDGSDESHSKKAAMDMREHQQEEERRKRDENDFAGEANLAEMDLESFFEKFADQMEEKVTGDDEDVDRVDEDENNDEEEESDEDEEEEEEEKESKAPEDEDAEASGSDDDEEDVDAATDRMRREMDKLQKSDPEFHKFLAENERSLLEFGGDDVDGQSDDEDEPAANDEDDSPSRTRESNKSGYILVDDKLITKLEQGAFKSHGIKSLRKLVAAYKTACHLSDANQDDGEEKEKKTGPKKYHIDSSAAFDQLMVMCLSRCHEEFDYHLVGEGAGHSEKPKKQDDSEENDEDSGVEKKENEPLSSKVLAKSKRWSETKPIIQSFFKSTLNVLGEAKEPELLTFILKALSKYVRFLAPFPRVADGLLKTFTSLWSAPLDSSEDYQVVRLNAFIRIRQLALTQPFAFIEDCLKKTYLAYANRAKFGTSASVTSLLPTLTFMGNCVVELYSLDYHSSYQHAFVYIRQLALHLRSAIQKKTPEALQAVYCWQYIHCLKLWVAVIASSCKQDLDDVGRSDEVQLLRSLIFPLTEVIMGVVRLVPTTRHLPLRLHCVRFLQQLAAAAEVFIPTTSILLDVLDAKELGMKPKKVQGRGGARGLQLALILKLPKESPLRTSEQLEACVSEVFLLLNREVDLYRYSAGFPEFSVAICQRLRKFSKETKNGRWRAYSKGCIELCERSSSFVIKGRATLGEAPKDVKRLEVLKPTNEPSMGDRYDVAIAKEKRLEEVPRPATAVDKSSVAREEAAADAKKEERKTDKKQAKKKKKEREVNQSDLANTQVLEEDDEVAEGIDWTDDDAESSDEE